MLLQLPALLLPTIYPTALLVKRCHAASVFDKRDERQLCSCTNKCFVVVHRDACKKVNRRARRGGKGNVLA
jgi:hypothetical protein